MFAFFFDEDHPDMPSIFGPECASHVIRAIQGACETHLLTGSLLHSSLVYRLGEVSFEAKPRSKSSRVNSSVSQTMVGDKDHFKTIICDLADTLATSSPGLSEDSLLNMLGRKNIWLVVTANIKWEEAVSADLSCQNFKPYLGFVSVDRDNPVHAYLFHDALFKDKFLSLDTLYFLHEEDDGNGFMSEYGAPKFKALNYEDFRKHTPALERTSSVSERGQLSSVRAAGPKPSYRERVAKKLASDSKPPRNFKFSVNAAPEMNIFTAEENKFRLYLLNPTHIKGAPKAKFFNETLGIFADDWRYLADQFIQGAEKAELYRVVVTAWEYTHGAIVRVTGRNGRQALVETGWKLQDDGPASFVTAYPFDGKDGSDVEPVESRVPSLDVTGDARHLAIYEIAVSRGYEAAKAATATPMVLNEWGTIWEGACGFAWVKLPKGNTPFARWLSRNDIGFRANPGREIYASFPDQSIVKKEAYANAFAEVLRANGIDCTVGSRLD